MNKYTISYNCCQTEFYVADSPSDILNGEELSDTVQFFAGSEIGGSNSWDVEDAEGNSMMGAYVDLNEDTSLDLKKIEGKYLLLVIMEYGNGEDEVTINDIKTLKSDTVNFGLIISLTDDSGEFYDLTDCTTEYDDPERSTKYFLVKNGKLTEQYDDGKGGFSE